MSIRNTYVYGDLGAGDWLRRSKNARKFKDVCIHTYTHKNILKFSKNGVGEPQRVM